MKSSSASRLALASLAVAAMLAMSLSTASAGQFITELKKRRAQGAVAPPTTPVALPAAKTPLTTNGPPVSSPVSPKYGPIYDAGAVQPRPIAVDSVSGADLFTRGHELYVRGDLVGARDLWMRSLESNPRDVRSRVWLDNTREEYARQEASRQSQMSQAERERERLALINAPVTIRTDRAVPLTEFMNIVSFSAPSNISYYVASGIDANVYGSFVDMPLGELLDNVLGPLGLTWSLDANNFLTVSSRLLPQTYRLNADQMNKVRALLDGGVLQQLVWGRPTPPSEGVEMTLDERSRLLTVVGSEQQIAKVTAFINSLESARTPDLETRIYRIRPELGPRVKSMIDALLAGRTASPFALQRDVIIAGSEMIVRDTPENLTRIEELLLDEAFIGRVSDQQLDIANFSLVPRNLENREAEELQTATARVVEAVKTFLYARVGEEAANRQGRRLWYDPAALQLTLVDTPDNLSRIGSYLGSLPELKAEQQEKYIALKHVLAADMASEIAQILGIETAATGGGGENQTCRRLSRGDQFEFQGMRIRLVRVEENDPQDRDDDSAELSLVTSTQSSQLNLREFDTVFFEDYQITAERINPSGGGGGNVRGGGGQTGRRGDGTAEICIEYTPPAIPPIP